MSLNRGITKTTRKARGHTHSFCTNYCSFFGATDPPLRKHSLRSSNLDLKLCLSDHDVHLKLFFLSFPGTALLHFSLAVVLRCKRSFVRFSWRTHEFKYSNYGRAGLYLQLLQLFCLDFPASFILPAQAAATSKRCSSPTSAEDTTMANKNHYVCFKRLHFKPNRDVHMSN